MGTFSSNIFASWSTAPAIPSRAANWSLNRRVFYSSFQDLSEIDVNNTGAPGYKWYPHLAWSNVSASSLLRNYATTPASSINITTPNVLTTGADPNGGTFGVNNIGITLATARDDGAGGFIGTAFQPPFYVEIVIPPTSGNFGFWAIPTELVLGQSSTYGELDFIEVGSKKCFITLWVSSTKTNHPDDNGVTFSSVAPGFSFSSSTNTLGFTVLPASVAGGSGIVEVVINGAHAKDITFFTTIDTQNYFLYIGPTTNLDTVQVWQT